MHRLAHGVVAAEREAEIRDAAGDARARAARLDQAGRLDERLRELCVLLDAGGDREHVRVEDHVLRGPAVRGQELVGAFADVDLALDRVGLALLVERHHDDRRAVAPDAARLLEEGFLPLLEADGVRDALALQALEPGLDHGPARAVDHDRDACDVRLRREQVEERGHRLLRIEQVGVHVDVEDVRAPAHLLERDLHRLLEFAGLDQAPEPCGSGHVRALADHHEGGVLEDPERLEPAQPRHGLALRDTSWGLSPGRVRNGPDVVGRGPAAAPDDVDQAVLGELTQVAARVAWLFVVRAHLVG